MERGEKCRGISSGCVFFFFFYYYYCKIQTSFVSESSGEKKAREKEREGEGEQEIGRCVISHLKFFVLLHANNSRGGRHFFGLGFKS